MVSDAKTGKNHLVVTFEKKASRWIYVLILLLAVGSSFYFYIKLDNISLLVPTLFCLFLDYIFQKISLKIITKEV